MNIALLATTAGAACMAMIALFIRMKAIKKPASIKKIILPPFFMSTGMLMFVYEPARLVPLQIIEALTVGIIFSFLLMRTTSFEVRNSDIYMKRSKAFAFILIGLLIARVIFKLIIGDAIEVAELGGMFYLLAFGMIIPWRIYMLIRFKEIEKRHHASIDEPASVLSKKMVK